MKEVQATGEALIPQQKLTSSTLSRLLHSWIRIRIPDKAPDPADQKPMLIHADVGQDPQHRIK